jgi:predicted DNA-binding transcriptional regulator AlpA
MSKKYYRANEAAEFLGIAVSTVWLYTTQKKLHSIKISKRVTVFDINELERFVEQAKESR